jgi:hypothetical protein
MHRIDHPTATNDNKFTEGSPGITPATVVTDDWLNDVQENIIAVIEGAGLALTKGRAADLLDAIRSLSREDSANQTLTNNQSNQNITAAIFASASIKSVIIEADVYRKDDTAGEKTAIFTLKLLQKPTGGTWEILENYDGDDCGVTFNLNVSGGNAQLRATTSNFVGANYSGAIRYKVRTFKI